MDLSNRIFSKQPISVALLIIILLIINSLTGYSQDSISYQSEDSLLQITQNQSTEFIDFIDSIKRADSLELAQLNEEISKIRQADIAKKQEMQARLDSIHQAAINREKRIKEQVDSLKANTKGIPVIIFSDTIFHIYAKLGPFKPSERATTIRKKVEFLVDDEIYDESLLRVRVGEESHDIYHGDIILASVTTRDAFWQNMSRDATAQLYLESIKQSVARYQKENSLMQLGKRIGFLVLILLGFILGIRYMNGGINWLIDKTIEKGHPFIKGIRIRKYEMLSREREEQLIIWVLKAFKWVLIVFFIYLSLPLLFYIFPTTKGISIKLIHYVLDPLKNIINSLIDYIPALITIIVISFIFHNVVRFLKFLSEEIESEKLVIPGFYPDWARSTFNILRIITYAFAFIVIFPYLPGSDSPVFRGVSVFLGLLLSLGSSSAIGNIIAGLVITYMRAFKIGDRVKIGENTGDVIEKSMLVTRIRTIKNEEVTIPNSAILNGSTTNYSSSAQHIGLILNTTITIGYDVPWRQVEKLLIEAAQKTNLIELDPKPFVLQTSLDDFYVSYQLNAYTRHPGSAAKIYSELHSHIQDIFAEADVEIMSPHYQANREGGQSTIPFKGETS